MAAPALPATPVIIIAALALVIGLGVTIFLLLKLEKKQLAAPPIKPNRSTDDAWQALLLGADALIQQQGLAGAIKLFQQASVLRDAVSWPVLFKLSRLQLQNQQPEQSLQTLNALSAQHPSVTLAYYARAELYQQAGDAASARAELEQLIALEPDHHGGLRLKASLLIEQGELAEAAQLLKSLADAMAHPAQLAPLQQALCAHQAAKPTDPDVLAIRGDLMYSGGQFDAALRYYRDAFRQSPESDPQVQQKLVKCLLAKAQSMASPQQAVALFNESLPLLDPAGSAYETLAVALAKASAEAGDTSTILALLTPLAKTTENPELHYLLGLQHERLKKNPEAIASYERCLSLDPRHALALYRLGTQMGMRGELQQALLYLKKAIQGDPQLVDAWFNLAVAQEQQDAPEAKLAALSAYERVLKLNPKHVEAANNLVMLKQEIGA
ncbi:MAG: tetratricopeptide repeat protein [Vampirovibrionales bacterium]|nr:tetratricopeptide repeat protein [Vampirovibrionales bacterium]